MFLAVRDAPIVALYGELVKGMKDLEVNSFELFVSRSLGTEIGYDLSKDEGIEALRKFLEDHGFTVCALLLENDFSSPNLAKEVEYILKGARIAEKLEVKVVRINPPMREIPGYTIRDYVELSSKAITHILKQNTYVHLAVENHGIIGNNVDYVRGLLEAVTDERLGVTLDTGNYYWYGYPLEKLYEIYRMVAPRVKHTHIKDAATERKNVLRRPREVKMSPIGKGDLDFRRILRILKEAGYEGDLTLEDESISLRDPEGSKKVLREDMRFLRSLLAELG